MVATCSVLELLINPFTFDYKTGVSASFILFLVQLFRSADNCAAFKNSFILNSKICFES